MHFIPFLFVTYRFLNLINVYPESTLYEVFDYCPQTLTIASTSFQSKLYKRYNTFRVINLLKTKVVYVYVLSG